MATNKSKAIKNHHSPKFWPRCRDPSSGKNWFLHSWCEVALKMALYIEVRTSLKGSVLSLMRPSLLCPEITNIDYKLRIYASAVLESITFHERLINELRFNSQTRKINVYIVVAIEITFFLNHFSDTESFRGIITVNFTAWNDIAVFFQQYQRYVWISLAFVLVSCTKRHVIPS